MALNRIIIIFLLTSSLMLSCGGNDPKPPQISKNLNKRIDTLFRNMTDSLDLIAESACDKSFDSLYKVAVDSMHQLRLKEIQEITDQ